MASRDAAAPAVGRVRGATALAAAAFLVAVALTVARHVVAPLFLDFGAALFYPARAFLAGDNPYDRAPYLATYPADAPFAYPPGVLVLALPFGALDLGTATVVYLALSIALVPVLAALALRCAGARRSAARVLALAALLLVSRPGHMVVVQGQPSLVFVVAAYAALALSARPRSHPRPRLSGAAVMLALALGKPTIGGPLALVALARGRVRMVAAAAALAAALSLVLVPPLAARSGGVAALVRDMAANEESWARAQDNDPATSVYRLDVVALTSRLAARPLPAAGALAMSVALLALGAFGARRLDRAGDDVGATALTCLTVVACAYHQTYDALLLTQALVAAARARGERGSASTSGPLRRLLLGALAVPFVNHAATHAVAGRLAAGGVAWLLVTSLNGAAVAAAFALSLVRAARAAPPPA